MKDAKSIFAPVTDPRTLAIADYTYDLPEERIAHHPLEERDATKLLLWQKGRIADHGFRELPEFLPADALLVLNDTRVVQARIAFRRTTGALLECMVLRPEGDRPMEQALQDVGTSRWWCMMGNAKRWKGEKLERVSDGHALTAEREDLKDGEHLITFRWNDGGTFAEQLVRHGNMPLPPYMRREAEADDHVRYNTVFAQHNGSVAAPTASLHFTPELLERVEQRGVHLARVTLHVGAGTFLPVKGERMEEHAMHSEQVRIPKGTILALREQLRTGAPIIPAGTTALRTIESLYWHAADRVLGRAGAQLQVDQWRPYADQPEVPVEEALDALLQGMGNEGAMEVSGSTRLLIAPGYRFRLATGLITNFHQPNSTLLLLVAALVGPEWKGIYQHALENGYRFLSYGDGSLLMP